MNFDIKNLVINCFIFIYILIGYFFVVRLLYLATIEKDKKAIATILLSILLFFLFYNSPLYQALLDL